MSKVGIIANPASGKDIRRLVAYASNVDNADKVNQLRRIILGIDATGVDEILIMPDYNALGQRALDGLRSRPLQAKTSILDMTITCTAEDSTTAAELMGELGVGCIVAEPTNMGLTSIGGILHPLGPEDEQGMYLKLGNGRLRVRAAVLPGIISEVGIEEWQILAPGEEVEVTHKPSVMALDGEREITVRSSDQVKGRLQKDGPPVVNIARTIREAVAQGFFRN